MTGIKKINLISAVLVSLSLCGGCTLEKAGNSSQDQAVQEDNETEQVKTEKAEKEEINEMHLRDKDSLYENADDTSVVTMYLTVSKGNSSENTYHTWKEINSYSVYDYEDMGVERYQVAGLLQVGDENGPIEGEVGYGESVPNATVQIRGQTSSQNAQKNYKIELKKNKGTWRGQRTINLNKHMTETDKDIYRTLISVENGRYSMDENILSSALQILSQLLHKHYGQKTIILIDEYDVPLDKAFQHGYYKEMVLMIRGVFGQALKTNDSLYFAVLTGCLRVSKESIFTGLNNFKVLSITDHRFDEHFGFTDDEVCRLLTAYGMEDHLSETKEWYDGYHFGNTDVYCPWDVINHVDCLRGNPDAEPLSYWINTSGNELVRRFIDRADKTTRDEIERLIAGESIEKTVRMELTYDEIDNSLDNLWSVLFTTGYLTQAGKTERGVYRLTIPNREIREVYVLQIKEWFDRAVLKEAEPTKNLLKAIKEGNAGEIEERLTKILGNTISIFDTKGRNEEKEIFYHGLLLGLLRSNPNWLVQSNAESGDGFADILAEPEDPDAGIVIELKYSQTFSGLQNACERALAQIREKRYDERLRNEGRNNILAYGVAFCKKRCKVAVQRL